MQKIPTLFARSEDRRYVIDEVTAGCEWVLTDPQAVATRKYDGTCVMIDANGQAFARRELKPQTLGAPPGFLLVGRDDVTGKVVGWEPADQSGFAKYIAEAIHGGLLGGTYELCGPKINGNPDGFDTHVLVRHEHAEVIRPLPPLTFSGLRDWMQRTAYEGIVWHHPDGRMAKLKRRDFPKAVAIAS